MCSTNWIKFWCLCIALGAVCTSTGCFLFNKKKRPKSDDIPPSTQHSNEVPIRSSVEDRPVKFGTLPFVYLMEHPGEVRIVDVTANRVLLTTRAGGRTIVSLDADRGVVIGGREVLQARLDPTHTYSIYLIDVSENLNRNVYERR